jgi:serine/threonine protein kinase
LLHRGALADVWSARAPTGERAALKIARAGVPGAAEALAREHRLLDACEHAGIVRALGLIAEPALSALVLEPLEGGDLVSLAGAAPRHWLAAAGIVAEALAFLHARGLVHRDVKARNVRFDARDDARLIDFGSVAAVGAPFATGGTTPAHRRPGRDPERISAADDVYAFAVLVYELMGGRLPFGPEPARAAAPVPARPLPGAVAGTPLAELEALVLETLAAAPEAVPRIGAFGNVIKSIRIRD